MGSSSSKALQLPTTANIAEYDSKSLSGQTDPESQVYTSAEQANTHQTQRRSLLLIQNNTSKNLNVKTHEGKIFHVKARRTEYIVIPLNAVNVGIEENSNNPVDDPKTVKLRRNTKILRIDRRIKYAGCAKCSYYLEYCHCKEGFTHKKWGYYIVNRYS